MTLTSRIRHFHWINSPHLLDPGGHAFVQQNKALEKARKHTETVAEAFLVG